jgi:DNA replication protein DnaC
LRVVERAGGVRVAESCVCRVERRAARMIEQARIPQRYAHCRLEEYVPNYAGNNRSLNAALVQARIFVKAYPFETNGNGLLLTGSLLRLSRPAEAGAEQLQPQRRCDGAGDSAPGV